MFQICSKNNKLRPEFFLLVDLRTLVLSLSYFQPILVANFVAIRVGTSIVRPVNSSGKCQKVPAWQILQKSLEWQILAFMNKIVLKHKIKVRMVAKIRNPYNQAPFLTQDTTWKSDKNTNKSQEVSPFPAGYHKAAMNRRECMPNTTNDPKKKYRLGMVRKNNLLEGLNLKN